jgi:hypothetical protein
VRNSSAHLPCANYTDLFDLKRHARHQKNLKRSRLIIGDDRVSANGAGSYLLLPSSA